MGHISDLDVMIRDLCHTRLRGLSGLRDLHAGRRGPDQADERVIVSVWASQMQMVEALGSGSESEPAELETIERTTDIGLEVLPIELSLSFTRPDPPRILRIYRGEVRRGELDSYVREARAGTYADAAARHEPNTLYLAVRPPGEFVTVSFWDDWTRIEAATGSNINDPILTQHGERLARGSAVHYELLPEDATVEASLATRPPESGATPG